MEHARRGTEELPPRSLVDVNAFVADQVAVAVEGRRMREPGWGCRVVEDYGPDVGVLRASPQELARVLQSVLSNAFEACEERASASAVAYEPAVTIRTRREEGSVQISVADNGAGVGDTFQHRVFEPFFTTKPAGSGHTGLGLSLAHETVVSGYGGRIALEGREGDGTTLTIALPA